MVLDGWCSAYERENSEDILAAARQAANFLVADLDEHGYYRTNGAFVSAGEIKTYTCLCAWAIYRFGSLVGEAKYRSAAIRSIEAALKQQHANGWFAHNCLARSDAPLTHTIGYALQGILEVGLLAQREDFIAAVCRTVQAIAERVHENGYLPGTFYDDWEPASFSSCLTGQPNSQSSPIVFSRRTENCRIEYSPTSHEFLKPLQAIDAEDDAVNRRPRRFVPACWCVHAGAIRTGRLNISSTRCFCRKRFGRAALPKSVRALRRIPTWAQSMKRLDGIVERCTARFNEHLGVA